MTPEELGQAIYFAIQDGIAAGEFTLALEDLGEIRVERPRQREHGDWATNIAMQAAKKAGMAPREFAERLAARLAQARLFYKSPSPRNRIRSRMPTSV
nr:MAG: hypothetical protein DIU73_06790 [Actinomycetota bacterium]